MASRKEQKRILREQRLERDRAAATAARRKRITGYAVGGALAAAVLAAAVLVVVVSGGGGGGGGGGGFPEGSVPKAKVSELAPAVRAAGCELRSIPVDSREHTEEETVRYASRRRPAAATTRSPPTMARTPPMSMSSASCTRSSTAG